jgi:hypothetical protein
MVDINNNKRSITDFIGKSITHIRSEFGEPRSIGIFCKPSEGLFTISFNIKTEITKEDIKSVEFEFKNIDSLIIESWRIESQKENSQWKYFPEGGIIEYSGVDKIYKLNRYLTYILWTIVRESTREIDLPTTLLSFEFTEFNSIIIHSNLDKFGRAITKLFRNETFDNYLAERDYYRSIKPEIFWDSMNPNLDETIKNLKLQKAAFYSSLTSEQIETLDKIILGQIDSIAFNIMRALDENNDSETGILLTVDNLNVRELPLIGNGNLSGEYFDWVERFSNHGQFQQQ